MKTADTIAPALCPQCAAQHRIATLGGPTCTHQPQHGANWFPSWWNDAGAESRRMKWLIERYIDTPEKHRQASALSRPQYT